MCGIALYIGEDHKKKTKDMMAEMTHRGFRENIVNFEYFSMGHVRLPIQGLDPKWDQPFRGRMAFVGEIFNHSDFGTYETDVLYLYEQLSESPPPENAFKDIDGFWSIFFYYPDKNFISVFTDHLAKKPLYIRKTRDYIAIASEIRPLLAIESENYFDPRYFSHIYKWGYSPTNRTPFIGIQKIPENTWMALSPGFKQVYFQQRYLDWPKPKKSFLRLGLYEQLEKAVKNRLVSDIPISILMSGGLDSTIVYQLLRKYTDNITVFHVDNQEEEYLNFIDFKGINVKKLGLKKEKQTVDFALWANQTPVDLGSMLPQYLLGDAIKKEGFNVAISGDGADELFGGYSRSQTYDSQISDIFDEIIFYHLPRLDRLMMYSTIELRCPFLAPNVIEYALSMPYVWRKKKEYLKIVFSDIVPPAILDRKKEALKIEALRTDVNIWRNMLIRKFKYLYQMEYNINEGGPNECERCI